MRWIMFLGMISLIVFSGLGSCQSQNEEDLFGIPPGCDTSIVTYSVSIVGILEANCYVCHAGETTLGPFRLDSYEALTDHLDQVLLAVNHASGVSPMPKDRPKLTDCELAKINKWIEEGAEEN